jgi:two-component system cell cycle response regulator DivK
MTDANRRILIIEDNFDNLFIYKTVLQHKGYTVLTADDGAEGLAVARAQHPDLILMDVSIPEIDGWQATSQLKADPETADIPVIILTAHALAADRERAGDSGADGYIPKPADPMSVVAAIDRTLSEPGFRVGLT